METAQKEFIREERFSCPCCGKDYRAKITAQYDKDKTATAFYESEVFFNRCQRCHKLCCPRCEYVAGEGMIVCTRCTTFADCKHNQMSLEQEIFQRLVKLQGRIKRIEVSWSASDGGPRMSVQIRGRDGRKLDEWNDWMVLGNEERPGTEKIAEIIRYALGKRAIANCEVGFWYADFIIQ